ncbi:uncharacterized protein LOC143018102 [Oratosquilla oratoria]|uniref:uncharacterized protein LOC143018102 n=1 Tax=Oratosquilla oratoria TaxID=337810 RepID=UPI003F75AB9C
MSKFISIEELKAQAESIGLKGDDVGRFVLNQQAFERDERTKERERERDKEQLDFRNDKIRVGENYRQFVIRLRQLFDNWLEACKVPQTFEALRQFFVLDQFLASLIPDMRLFIKEQSVISLESAVVKADDWASAHKAYPKPNTNYASGKTSFPRRKTNVVESLPPPSHGSTHQDTKGGAFRTPMRCFNCGEEGHHRSRCPKNPRAFKDKEAQSQFKVGFCMSNRTTPCFTVAGTINGSWTSTIVRDTGCNCVLVSEEAVPDADVSLCPKVSVADFLGRVNEFPVAHCYIRCPYYEGWVDAVRAPMKCASVLIGNVPGARDPSKPDPFPFKPHASSLDTTTHSTLPTGMQTSNAAAAPITKTIPPPTLTQESTFQIYVVETRRSKMKRVHPLQMPALQPLSVTPEDFCSLQESCPTLAGLWDKTKSEEMDQTKNGSSFQYLKIDGLLYRNAYYLRMLKRVAIDLVGPLSPPSAEGHRYILTLIDFATGFPEAVPLKEVDSISVAEAFLTIFTRVGIPREILSDQGTQFTSQLMAELHKFLGVKPSFTTPFHPSGNGRVERLHGPLKAALRKMFRDLWEDRSIKDDDHSTLSYVIKLQDKLAVPTDKSKLLVAWKGPYEVLEKRGKVDYVSDSPTGPKLYHANLLKKYYRRPSVAFAELLDEPSTIDDSSLHKEICLSEPEDSRLPVTPDGQTDETFEAKRCTSTVEHDIILTTTDRIRMKVHPVPVHLKPHLELEVERLFQQGIHWDTTGGERCTYTGYNWWRAVLLQQTYLHWDTVFRVQDAQCQERCPEELLGTKERSSSIVCQRNFWPSAIILILIWSVQNLQFY